ncbi:unnamed protein product, partial [marine sediment metagenome]
MKDFNNFIIYKLPPQEPEDESLAKFYEFTIKQQTHCEKLEDGRCVIVFGGDSTEENIIGDLNHEYLHASLHFINESLASKNLKYLWYRNEFEESILFKKIVEELSYSGIGYPDCAGILDRIRAFLFRIQQKG